MGAALELRRERQRVANRKSSAEKRRNAAESRRHLDDLKKARRPAAARARSRRVAQFLRECLAGIKERDRAGHRDVIVSLGNDRMSHVNLGTGEEFMGDQNTIKRFLVLLELTDLLVAEGFGVEVGYHPTQKGEWEKVADLSKTLDQYCRLVDPGFHLGACWHFQLKVTWT